tara:strand:+ start:4612 stop:5679 length:1068 start_codon:yes stop_codon:yes gene_type:complete
MVYQGPGISSLISYLSYILLIGYYILSNKTKPNLWMIAIGLLFFSISSLSDSQYLPVENRDFLVYILKYFITVICGYELLKNTSSREITLFLFIGALTIILQIFFFNNPLLDNGRYSGFYLNPNTGGFICLIGYGLTFAAENKKFRLILQVVFTIMGLLTFSRTFILLWLLTNLIAVRIDIKNLRVFLYGFGLLTVLVVFSEFLPVKNPRLEQIKAFIKGDQVQTQVVSEDSRTETWSLYYDALFDHPFLGSGYNSFSGYSHISPVGAHNTYLKIWGEAGIIVISIFLAMYIIMIRDSLEQFKIAPHLFLITIAVVLFLSTFHNYFDNGYILFISMWIQAEINRLTTSSYTQRLT